MTSMRHYVSLMVICIYIQLLTISPALASQLHLVPLKKDTENIVCVLRVKVTNIEHEETHMTLENGTKGPLTFGHIIVSGTVNEVVWGDFPAKTIKTRYTWQSGAVYNNRGELVITKSLVRSGSGMEGDVKKGEEYLFSYRALNADANKNGELIFSTLRTDPVSRKYEILDLLQDTKRKRQEGPGLGMKQT